MNNRALLLLLLLLAAGWVPGENLRAQATTSPYSMFGIGEIDPGNYGENSGMAGIGIGFRQINSLNNTNPAALVSILPQTFIFDGSFYGKTAWYTGQGKKEFAGSGNIRRIAIGFRAANRWTMSVGMTPFSTVGYDIRTSSPIEGSSGKSTSSFTGSGGLNKVYVSQAFSITPKWSVGVNASLIFGTVTHTEGSSYWTSEQKSRGEKVYFDFGMQYTEKVGKNAVLTLGAIGGYAENISMYNTRLSYDYDGNIATNTVTPSTSQYLPAFYGGGATLNLRKWTVGADYLFQQWSRGSLTGSVQYKDMQKLSIGASFVPAPNDVRNYWKIVKYQLGVSANDSYLTLGRGTEYNYAVTAGAVFPVRNRSSLYFSAEYGKNTFLGSSRNTVRENYFKFTVGFSFKETWFMRIKYD